MLVVINGMKGQGDKCDLETVVSFAEILSAY
jgi:hypothetical protein